MILQNLLFPKAEFCPVETAYFRKHGLEDFRIGDFSLDFKKNETVSFDTYFNAFSIEKWQKYTTLSNVSLAVELKGKFHITLLNVYKHHNEVKTKQLAFFSVNSDEKKKHTVKYPIGGFKGLFYFKLEAMEDGAQYFGGEYLTDVSQELLPDIKFALDICTYKREDFILRNITQLKNNILDNPSSPLYRKMEVYIADNGQTLDPEMFKHPCIHLFPNKNLGGAGGFGRNMMEIADDATAKKFTHIIMLDDDITLDTDSFLRVSSFYKLIKPEFADAFIGGAMLNSDMPHIQSESGDYWNVSTHSPVKFKYPIKDLGYVIKNEIEDSVNYFGWWYCAMPIGLIEGDNLPLPIFIKRDDVEYGIRNGKHFVSLNGLCVLHEDFNKKRSSFLDYYYWRNLCILNAIHFYNYSSETLKNQLRDIVHYYSVRLRYKDALLCFKGVEDFLRGVDWLKRTDAETLHKDVMNFSYKAVPIQLLDVRFTHGLYEKALQRKLTDNEKKDFKATNEGLNSSPIPNRTVYAPAVGSTPEHFYKAQHAIHYDEMSNTAFVTSRSQEDLKMVNTVYAKLCALIDKRYDTVKTEYYARWRELVSRSFWNKYITQTEFTPKAEDAKSILVLESKNVESQNWSAERVRTETEKYNDSLQKRFLSSLLFWYPRQKNRITFYLNNRAGYFCNPKYIAEYLLKHYPNKFEYFWITSKHETCQEQLSKGFEVYESESFKHFKVQWRSNVVITNDAFPASIKNRLGQLTINTWHAGMNYKAIGFDSLGRTQKIQKKQFEIKNKQPSVYLSGSQYFTDDTSKSFHFDKKIFAPTGMPRNDIFFQNHKNVVLRARATYGVSQNTKILLYAPTFRGDYKFSTFDLDFEQLLNALEQRYGGDWVVFFRKHYFTGRGSTEQNPRVIDVSAYPDMQELMCAADMLISDYSSCLWDFTFTGRPALVYAPDLKNYSSKDRSFSYPLEKWPYPISYNNSELENTIMNFDSKAYDLRVQQHHKDAGAFDDGHACERVAKIICDHCGVEFKK